MHHKKDWQQLPQYEPESWRGEMPPGEEGKFIRVERGQSLPSARDQTKVMELLGKVNYKIIHGKRGYVEVDGVVYKTLYGGFLRCGCIYRSCYPPRRLEGFARIRGGGKG